MASPYRYNGEGSYDIVPYRACRTGCSDLFQSRGTVAVRAAPDTALCARWAEAVLIPAHESCEVRLTFDQERSEWPSGRYRSCTLRDSRARVSALQVIWHEGPLATLLRRRGMLLR